jgi:hypothetical protein
MISPAASLGKGDYNLHPQRISEMWITIAVVWSAFLAGFLLGAWWSASRSISEMNEYYDVLSREFKPLLDSNGREVAAGGERSCRDASMQPRVSW